LQSFFGTNPSDMAGERERGELLAATGVYVCGRSEAALAGPSR